MDSESKIVRCFEEACADAGLKNPGPENIRQIIGLGMLEAVEALLPSESEEERQAVIAAYRDHFLIHDQTEMEFFPGVIDGLQDLKNHGFWLAVATGKARPGLDRLLKKYDMEDQFVSTRCADEAFSKPHPKMLEDILDETGVEACDAVMVGDTSFDMEMARNARVDPLAVTYGVHDKRRLDAFDPLGYCQSFGEVYAWLT